MSDKNLVTLVVAAAGIRRYHGASQMDDRTIRDFACYQPAFEPMHTVLVRTNNSKNYVVSSIADIMSVWEDGRSGGIDEVLSVPTRLFERYAAELGLAERIVGEVVEEA